MTILDSPLDNRAREVKDLGGRSVKTRRENVKADVCCDQIEGARNDYVSASTGRGRENTVRIRLQKKNQRRDRVEKTSEIKAETNRQRSCEPRERT